MPLGAWKRGDGAPEAPTGRVFAGLFLLTAVTGMVDATSFLGLQSVFTANMTGNVLILGFAVTGSPAVHQVHLSLTLTATALGGFVAGAGGGGWIVGRRTARARLRTAFAVEVVVLVGAVVLLGLWDGSGEAGSYGAVVLLSVAMGLQNAAVRRMGIPDVNTTVLTTSLAGLAADWVEVGGRPALAGRRVATVACLFIGAIAGAALEQRGIGWAAAGALAALVLAVGSLLPWLPWYSRPAPPPDRLPG